MKAMKTSHPVRGLTLRAVAASLLGMLLAGIYTQVSAVLLAESYLIAEAALPVPAMIVLVFLVLVAGAFAAAFKFRLLTRPELVCVAFAMMMAVPMMTQGFWHRFLGITAAPLRTASFDYLDAYHDNLWPHGPNLVAGALDAADAPTRGGVRLSTQGGVVWEEIEWESGRVARLPVIENATDADSGALAFEIPVDRSRGGAPEPGNPHLVTVLTRAEGLERDSEIFCRVYADGSPVPSTLFTDRSPSKKTYLHQTGFVRIGAYGKVLAANASSNLVVQFGLAGRGRVAFADPKVMSVAALEGAFRGREAMTESEYNALPPAERPAGVAVRPDRMLSLRGLAYRLGGYIPLREWARPALVWSAYLFLLCGAFFAVNAIMRRKWADGDRYPMPNAKIPLGIIGAEDDDASAPFASVWRNRFLWAGFVFAMIVGGLKGWHAFNPRVPDPSVVIKLGDYVADPAWGGMFDASLVLSLFIISIAVFFELNVLLSIVVGYWACRLVYPAGYLADFKVNAGFPWRDEQTIGAYIGYALIVLVLSRRHFAEVLKGAWKGLPRAEGEVLSSRAAVALLAFCHVGVMAWARLAGAGSGSMLLMFAFLVMVGFVAAKIRAECGTPFGYFTPYNSMLFVTLCGGMAVFGTGGQLVSLILSGFLTVTVFYLIPGMQFEMVQIGKRMRLRPWDVAGTCLLGLFGGLFIGGWVFLSNAYSIGGDNVRFQWAFNGLNWFMNSYRAELNETTAAWLRGGGAEPAGGASAWGVGMMVYGGVATMALAILRQFFSGFWFHPVGFLLGATNLNEGANWGSLLVAWAIRYAVLKVGGATAVTKKLQPFFLGAFMGCVASIAMFTVVNAIAVSNGSTNFYSGIP